MQKMSNAWLGGCLVVLAAASCDFPRLSPLADGGIDGMDGAPIDGGEPELFDLELLAGDIGGVGNVDGTGAAARFSSPSGVAVDGTGNLYVADTSNSTIRKVTPAGVVTTIAGSAGLYGSLDGAVAAARFDLPSGVALDGAGNLYVADSNNSTIRKITPAGVVTTIAGSAGMEGSTDGAGAAARFQRPSGVAVDSAGNLYVADRYNATVRKITAAGVVSTLAGTAGVAGSTDGTGAGARFDFPSGVAVDGVGNVYVADTNNATIRKVTPTGVVTTLAGTAGTTGSADGTGAAARFSGPTGVTVDDTGNLYVADQSNHVLRKITPAGVVTTLSGTAGMTGSTDGTGAAARFRSPAGVAVDGAGNVYVADLNNHVVRKVTSTGIVTTPAGAPGVFGSADGAGATPRFHAPSSVAADRAGNLYVADTENDAVRMITPAGVVTTLAGTAGMPGGEDGAGAAARFNFPSGVAVDGDGSLYIADTDNATIRKITPAGVVTTLAGTAGKTGSTDSTGAAARFNFPTGVAVDDASNIYVADRGNHVIRKITPAGIVTTLAGTAGAFGKTDGAGAAARFTSPTDIAIDRAGNLYVTDQNNQTVRTVTPAGVVTTLAGTAGMPGSTDGNGGAARFNSPFGVAVDGAGNVYVADNRSSTIRKITPTGATTTLAGTAGATGIRLGEMPRLAFPRSVALVGDDLIIADANAILRLRHRAQ